MKGKIDLEPWEISELTPWFEGGIYALETLERWEQLELDFFNITPDQVIQMLKHLGYKQINYDCNGWEQDTWFYFSHPEHKKLCFFYSGRYGSMNISLVED